MGLIIRLPYFLRYAVGHVLSLFHPWKGLSSAGFVPQIGHLMNFERGDERTAFGTFLLSKAAQEGPIVATYHLDDMHSATFNATPYDVEGDLGHDEDEPDDEAEAQ